MNLEQFKNDIEGKYIEGQDLFYYSKENAIKMFESVNLVNHLTQRAKAGKYTTNIVKKKKTVEVARYIFNKIEIEYLNIPFSLDIETSNFEMKGQKVALPYLWQFNYCGKTIIGFDILTSVEFLDLFSEYHQLKYNVRHAVVYIHNLSFEHCFYKNLLSFVQSETFSVKQRMPIKAMTTNGIEFRDSAILTGSSLEKAGDDLLKYNVRKLKEIMNYELIRTPDTIQKGLITKDKDILNVIKYSANDVKVLSAVIQEKIDEYGNILKIPMTATGAARQLVRKTCFTNTKDEPFRKLNFMKTMEECTLSEEVFDMAKKAFAGGFTHANKVWAGKVLKEDEGFGVVSADLTSAHPASLCMMKAPMDSGKQIQVNSLEEMFDLIDERHCYLIQFTASKVQLKPDHSYETPLSFSKANYVSDSYISTESDFVNGKEVKNENVPVIDNGRLMMADCINYTMTELDFQTFVEFYDFDEIYFQIVYEFKADFLPKPFLEVVATLYKAKTELKDKWEEPGLTEEQILDIKSKYSRSKALLNALYGMLVYNFAKDLNVYNEERDIWTIETIDICEALEKENENERRFSFYLWGVWCSSFTKNRALFPAIRETGSDHVYSDTDSEKFLNYEKHIDWFKWYNEEVVKERLLEMCKARKLDFEMFNPANKDGKHFMIGAWDIEGQRISEGRTTYHYFQCQGAKRYCFTEYKKQKDGSYKEKFEITVAGCPKDASKYWLKKNGSIEKAFENFKNVVFSNGIDDKDGYDGFFIPSNYSDIKNEDGSDVYEIKGSKLCHTYIDKPVEGDVIDKDGNEYHFKVLSGCHLEKVDFRMGIDNGYYKLLSLIATKDESYFDSSKICVDYVDDFYKELQEIFNKRV